MNIIVSGASQGIGRDTVISLANSGHHVLAIARSKERLMQLKEQYPLVETLSLDLSKERPYAPLVEKLKEWGRVDGLINNAGQLINLPFMQTSPQQFIEQYQGNVITVVNLVQTCFPFLGKGSHVVNISSMGGVQGSSKFAGLSAYSASKGALTILTECMAEEFKERGISVNALALGAVQTEMLQKAFPSYSAPITSREMAAFIADFVLTKGKYFNGKVLPVALGNP